MQMGAPSLLLYMEAFLARGLSLQPGELDTLRRLLSSGLSTREVASAMDRTQRFVLKVMAQHDLKSTRRQFGKRWKNPETGVWFIEIGGKVCRAGNQDEPMAVAS